MKQSYLLILAIICSLTFACKKKDVECDATLCVINQTSDTLRYCWGCNSYTEKIPPGQKACRDVGHIKIKHGLFGTEESTVNVNFDTPGATYVIPVDECNEERIF